VKRAELEHVIRAAADVTGDTDIVIVGSQAILGQFPEAPAALLISQEADVYPRNRPEKAIDVDGALGDGSYFHQAFGYYAHGVGPETAKAPLGWEMRLVPVRVPLRPGATGEATGWCMEAHDLVLAKCVAGRDADRRFAEAAIRYEIVDREELRRRIPHLPLPTRDRDRVDETLGGIIARAQR
jgi:hypothetical protein